MNFSDNIWLGKAKNLSEDHKPTDPVEQSRIEKAGGHIDKDLRVNGGLNLSRAIGKIKAGCCPPYELHLASLYVVDEAVSKFISLTLYLTLGLGSVIVF